MGQKAITIYTPDGETPHISADDDAFIYRTIFGAESGILGGLTCMKSSGNSLRLTGGGVMNRGRILRIPDGEEVELTVANGTAGYRRYDSVIAELIKGGGDTADIFRIRLLTGAPAADAPQAPSLTKSSLLNQGDCHQVELFRVLIEGTDISSVNRVAVVLTAANGGSGGRMTWGTDAPSGGSDGDIYFRIVG